MQPLSKKTWRKNRTVTGGAPRQLSIRGPDLLFRQSALLNAPLVPNRTSKRMLLGPWGTPPVQNFSYAHLNHASIPKARVEHELPSADRGHGGPASSQHPTRGHVQRGTHSAHPRRNRGGALPRLFLQFLNFTGGIPQVTGVHRCPGFHHTKGGRTRLFISHAFARRFDNPGTRRLLPVIGGRRSGDPTASTPACTRTSSSTPANDGAVLPESGIERLQDRQSHLVLARIGPRPNSNSLLRVYGWRRTSVAGHETRANAPAG